MIEYIKEDGKTYKVTTTRAEVDVKALQTELKDWEGMIAPSDEEVNDMGRGFHPYYLDREYRIEELKRKIEVVK